MERKCKRCDTEKDIAEFYEHPKGKEGRDTTCKVCRRELNKTSNGKISRSCVVCGKSFNTTQSEVNRGGGNCCSRICWHKHFPKIVGRGENSPNWKGDDVGITALHNWVERELGKPKKCEHCGDTSKRKYDWANKSQEYKRELTDWIRLCRACHTKYDYPTRQPKWRESVTKRGWKVKEINN